MGCLDSLSHIVCNERFQDFPSTSSAISTVQHTCPMNINNVFLLTLSRPFFLGESEEGINKDIDGFLVRFGRGRKREKLFRS